MGCCFLYGQRLVGSGGSGDGGDGGYSLILDGSLPKTAAEGTISVDPASFPEGCQASGTYIFSMTEPEAEEGLLWFQTASEGKSVIMDSPIHVSMNLRNALLYHGMEWAYVEAYVWARSKWENFHYGDAGIPDIVPWATGTDAQIARMVAAMDAGTLSVEDSGWQVGDMRRVYLNAMESYGVLEAQPAQYVDLVLVNVGGKTLADGRECHFVVQQKDALLKAGAMNDKSTESSSSWIGWDKCLRRKWCNDVYSQALPEKLLPIFKRFQNDGYYRGPALSQMVDRCIDLFALPGEGECFSSRKLASSYEAGKLTLFSWYSSPERLVKRYGIEGMTGYWHTRSLEYGKQKWMVVTSEGGAVSYDSSYGAGIAPFGCI